MIPSLTKQGVLPPGIWHASLEEFTEVFGKSSRRKMLLAGLEQAAISLLSAGWTTLFIDGSFVTDKPEPGDYDACWDITDVAEDLLDPVFFDFSDHRAAQKQRYGGEFFPAQLPEGLSGRTFLEFFQQDREGRSKGIIVLELQEFAEREEESPK
jgi:hypothetical protein